VVSDDLYTQILSTLSKGVGITIFVFPQAFRTIMPPLGNDFIFHLLEINHRLPAGPLQRIS